jgi:hypothetical protein
MKKEVQIDLTMTQRAIKKSPIQVNSWVNKALDARNNLNDPTENGSGRKLQLNMTFSKSILNRR